MMEANECWLVCIERATFSSELNSFNGTKMSLNLFIENEKIKWHFNVMFARHNVNVYFISKDVGWIAIATRQWNRFVCIEPLLCKACIKMWKRIEMHYTDIESNKIRKQQSNNKKLKPSRFDAMCARFNLIWFDSIRFVSYITGILQNNNNCDDPHQPKQWQQRQQTKKQPEQCFFIFLPFAFDTMHGK